jgi:hypothetical protein
VVFLESTATISPCEKYRYDLWRLWDREKPRCVFLMLNPSTATAEKPDPTMRKCVGFAERAGCGSLTIVNLFAFRATKPKDMFAAADPVGPDNDAYICRHARPLFGAGSQPLVVAAWGASVTATKRPVIRERPFAVRLLLGGVQLKCLGTTGCGNPCHPVMLGYNTPLIDYPTR